MISFNRIRRRLADNAGCVVVVAVVLFRVGYVIYDRWRIGADLSRLKEAMAQDKQALEEAKRRVLELKGQLADLSGQLRDTEQTRARLLEQLSAMRAGLLVRTVEGIRQEWQLYWDSRRGALAGKSVRERWPNGQVAIESLAFEEGGLGFRGVAGVWKDDAGTTIARGKLDGSWKKQGSWYEVDEDGVQLWSEYKDDRFHGAQVVKDPEGLLVADLSFADNELDGPCLFWAVSVYCGGSVSPDADCHRGGQIDNETSGIYRHGKIVANSNEVISLLEKRHSLVNRGANQWDLTMGFLVEKPLIAEDEYHEGCFKKGLFINPHGSGFVRVSCREYDERQREKARALNDGRRELYYQLASVEKRLKEIGE